MKVSVILHVIHYVPFECNEPHHTALRIEWARSRARAERWEEHVCKTVEAMRRVLQYTQSVIDDWKALASRRAAASHELKEGLQSYALEQAAAEEAFYQRLSMQWYATRVRAFKFLLSLGYSQSDLINVLGLPLPPTVPNGPQFLHLNELIPMETHEPE